MIERKLRKSEFKRRLKHGSRSPFRRYLAQRYLNLTDEEYENIIYEPLEKEKCKTT
jgi:hypothetical protein